MNLINQPYRPLIISHAACAGHAPENTLAGIRAALDLGADAVEVDVRASADSVPILMHDPTIDRTTDGYGAVATLSLAQIKRLDAGIKVFQGAFRGESVPTLAEALAVTRGRALLIAEIKQKDIASQIVEVIHDASALDALMVWSFFPQILAVLRSAEPRLPCCLLAEQATAWPQTRELALRLGLQGVSIHHRSLSQEVANSARRSALALYTWTVDNQEDIQRALGSGVDGIVTNYPERLAGLRNHP